ncbi:amidophosphoribosyltransferase [Salipiger sp. 1_MG-2023]|uniref:amidophosphoribosyltransferase n=1 Tax=Salipiger sp. 1_MG-2023 TaxID=3062665 RepID=UPI0026E15278|nr:amidophosphoribosyltransferase [Salipiger sp. 1_MG-2023]MDO6587591.1 amidophosphoribosyltransferase [Salipiger sp. 1_MG-2023]
MTNPRTPDAVARTATVSADIPSRGIVLLGTFGSESAPRALLRLPGGNTATVQIGSRVGRQQVVAIDDSRIALASNGRGNWVSVPGSD